MKMRDDSIVIDILLTTCVATGINPNMQTTVDNGIRPEDSFQIAKTRNAENAMKARSS